MASALFLSVDLDEWYLARWATGASGSVWPDLDSLFQEVYGGSEPAGELIPPVQQILGFFDEIGFKSTFFVTGVIAGYYPDLVREIADRGHEIACHNFRHIDYATVPEAEFRADLTRSKAMLEDLSRRVVIG